MHVPVEENCAPDWTFTHARKNLLTLYEDPNGGPTRTKIYAAAVKALIRSINSIRTHKKTVAIDYIITYLDHDYSGDIGACDGKFAGDIILGDSMILIPVDIAWIGGGIGNRFADGSFNLFASSIQMPSSLLLIRKPSASPITHEAAALVCKKN